MVAKTDISQSRFKNRSFAFADVNGLINSLKSSKQGGLEYGNAGTHAKMTINAGYYRFAPIENRKLKIENRSYDAWGKQTVENWMKLELSQIVGIASLFHFDKSANGFEWFMQSMNNGAGELVQGFIGKSFAHMQNIGGHIDKVGYYKGRTTIRLNDGHIGKNLFGGISFGHYIFGRNMALNPNDAGYNLDLFAHEFGHTYQSIIAGPLYLFKYGIPSAAGGNSSEIDANRRAAVNGLPLSNLRTQGTNRTKWWEVGLAPVLWPFMWSWNF